jgi:hypothetical protein
MSYIEDKQRGEIMGADISLGLFGMSFQQSTADIMRKQRDKLLEKLQAGGNSDLKERKSVIVELASLDKGILQAAYHEETVRLENKRLKNEEYTALSIRARNKVRRQRENLLRAESMRRLSLANNQLNDQIQGNIDKTDSVAEDVKAAQELSAEAAQVAQRRKNDEWKEYLEEKVHKRKKGPLINISI